MATNTPSDKEKSAEENKSTQRKEDPQQVECFEKYYAMGDKRSYRALGEIVGKNKRTLFDWGRRFKWKERILERDEKVKEALWKAGQKKAVALKDTMLNVWQAALAKCFVRNDDGKTILNLTPSNIADLSIITKNLLLLSGEPTERIEFERSIVVRVLNAVDELISDEDIRFKIYERLSGMSVEQQVEEVV